MERLRVLRDLRAARRLDAGRSGAAAEDRPVLDRWILSQAARTAATVEARLLDVDAVGATRALSAYLDGLSTWYLRLSRRRFSRSEDPADQRAAFATLHEALVVAAARMLRADPALPVRVDVRRTS